MFLAVTFRFIEIIQFLDHAAPAQLLMYTLWEMFFLHDGGQLFDQLKYSSDGQTTRTAAENSLCSRATRLILTYFNVSVGFSSYYTFRTLTMTTSAAYNPVYVRILLPNSIVSCTMGIREGSLLLRCRGSSKERGG